MSTTSQSGGNPNAIRPGVLGSLRSQWPLAAGIYLIAVALAALLGLAWPQAYEAVAQVIVEDPRAATVVSPITESRTADISSERYLADQVEILESAETAAQAAELLGPEWTPRDIIENRTIVGSETSNLIEVEFRAEVPADAKAGADALVNAYLDIRRQQAEALSAGALNRIDALQPALEAELAEVNNQIEDLVSGDGLTQDLNTQIEEALVTLGELQQQRAAAAPGSEARQNLNDQIAELLVDFNAWETALRAQNQDPRLTALLREQESLTGEIADLTTLRNSIEVDTQLASGGIALFSPAALPTDPVGVSPVVLMAGLVLLGVLVAVGAAHRTATRNPVIRHGAEAELAVGAPFLGFVPRLKSGKLEHPLTGSRYLSLIHI